MLPVSPTYTQSAALDSLGVFLQSELTRLDPIVHAPLYACTWSRDVPARTDVGVGNDGSAFLKSAFASVGGTNNMGLNWISSSTTTVPAVNVDMQRVAFQLIEWGSAIQFSYRQLEESKALGRPIDVLQLQGLNMKHQMDVDHATYIGNSAIQNSYGLLNCPEALSTTQATTFETLIQNQNPHAVQTAILTLQADVWQQTGFSVCPNTLLLPPEVYNLLNTTVSSAGTQSIMEYLKVNNSYTEQSGKRLDIYPVKWLCSLSAQTSGNNKFESKDWLNNGGKGRAVFYHRSEDFVRMPMTPLLKTPITYMDMWMRVGYWGLVGHIEVVYPEAIGYLDGVS